MGLQQDTRALAAEAAQAIAQTTQRRRRFAAQREGRQTAYTANA
jgi:hypothetical protein